MNEQLQNKLAQARYQVATTVLQASNAPDIVKALHELTMLYATAERALKKSKKKSKKKQSKRMKHAADEFYTITMCAIYNGQPNKD